jgi:hypothetical protein
LESTHSIIQTYKNGGRIVSSKVTMAGKKSRLGEARCSILGIEPFPDVKTPWITSLCFIICTH